MFDNLRRIWNPEQYHGFQKKNDFFEGWYFKNIGEDKTSILSIIPGIFKSKEKSKEHSFIQFIDGITRETHYIKFKADEFKANNNKFEIKIGNCFFSDELLSLDIEFPDFRAFGELRFKDKIEWKRTFLSPGVMGWYSFIPFMECNHDIISMSHNVRGKILINKNVYLFTFGRGYIEKDWGRSFPSSYIWMQSNNFDNDKVSFFCSIANIPWIGYSFRGFICGININGKLYKFATYTGAKLSQLKINDNSVSFDISDNNYLLEVNANKSSAGMLLAPYNNQMIEGRVHETLLSEIYINLNSIQKKGNIKLFEGKGKFAGLEIVGNLNEIS